MSALVSHQARRATRCRILFLSLIRTVDLAPSRRKSSTRISMRQAECRFSTKLAQPEALSALGARVFGTTGRGTLSQLRQNQSLARMAIHCLNRILMALMALVATALILANLVGLSLVRSQPLKSGRENLNSRHLATKTKTDQRLRFVTPCKARTN